MDDPSSVLNRARWREVDIEVRLRDFQTSVVFHPELKDLVEKIRKLLEIRKLTGRGFGIRVIAASNRGKSTIIRLLQELLPPQITDTRTKYPFLSFDIAGHCSTKGVFEAIRKSLNVPIGYCKTESDLREKIFVLMDEDHAAVKVLAIDNIQDIPERRAKKGVNVVGNAIRDVSEKLNVILLLFGTKETELIVENNGQLRRRVPAKIELCSQNISTPIGMSLALRMVKEFEKHLPLAAESELAESRIGKALVCASDGSPGAMKSLLSVATLACVRAGREKLTAEDLSTAYLQLYAGFINCNPFHEEFRPWRRLNRPGEPHYDAEEWVAQNPEKKS